MSFDLQTATALKYVASYVICKNLTQITCFRSTDIASLKSFNRQKSPNLILNLVFYILKLVFAIFIYLFFLT